MYRKKPIPKFVNKAKVLRASPDYMSAEDTLVEVARVKQAVQVVTSPKEYHIKAFKLMTKLSDAINSKINIANPTVTFANKFVQ